jgi:hypothetical protein
MQKLDQAMSVLTLTMGLCLMREGYGDLTVTRLSGFDLLSATWPGGDSIQAALSFSDATPMRGAVVTMTSTDPSAVPVSAVRVPAGKKVWRLSIPTGTVKQSERVTITASYGGVKKSMVAMVQMAGLKSRAD